MKSTESAPRANVYATSASRPGRAGSAAIPGTTWLPPPSGTRTGFVHATPSADRETTMSFAPHPARAAQSGQASTTAPSAPTSAEGSGAARRPGTSLNRALAIGVPVEKLAPPSSECTAAIAPPS